MGLFLFRFWPVLVPLLIYWLWHCLAVRRAKRTGEPVPRFRDGPWYWAVIASLLTAVGCFLYIAVVATEGERGDYVPPHMEDGRLVPGQVGRE